MKVEFADGVRATLTAVSKTRGYRPGYRDLPANPLETIFTIAQGYIPPNWPPCDHLAVVVESEEWLREQFASRTLPPVMVVAEFVAYIHQDNEQVQHSHQRLVWLQHDLAEDIPSEITGILKRRSWASGGDDADRDA